MEVAQLLAISEDQRQLAEDGIRHRAIRVRVRDKEVGRWRDLAFEYIGAIDCASGQIEDLTFIPRDGSRPGRWLPAYLDRRQSEAWIAAEPERQAAKAKKEADAEMLRAVMLGAARKPVSVSEIQKFLARESIKIRTRPEQLSQLRSHFAPRPVTERLFKEATQGDKRPPGRRRKS